LSSKCLSLSQQRLAELIAYYLGLPFSAVVPAGDVLAEVFPTPYSIQHKVIAMKDAGHTQAFVLCNPLEMLLLDQLKQLPTAPSRESF